MGVRPGLALATVVGVYLCAPWGPKTVFGQGACCSESSCDPATDEVECFAMGGVFLPGEDCADGACDEGACCAGLSCAIADAYTCITNGRVFGGTGTTCLDDPCESNVGACCNAGSCSDVSPEECASGGGVWMGAGTNCENDICRLGGCCVPGACLELANYECDALEGAFTAGADCASDPCEVIDSCRTDSLYAHTPDLPDFIGAYQSEAAGNIRRWDGFAGVLGAIEELTWFGLDLEWDGADWLECVDLDSEFDISFYEDDAGEPGAAVCEYTLTATRTPTQYQDGGIELLEFHVILPTPCVLTHGWFSVQGLGDPTCWFLWLNSRDGDGFSLCDGCAVWVEAVDLSFCLGGGLGGVFGACCDEATGTCGDGVEITECGAIDQRFVADVFCEELDPGCTQVTGACCFGDGSCAVEPEVACMDAGGTWLGQDAPCADCPAIGACCVDFQNCGLMTEEDCVPEGHGWLGEGTTCDECPSAPQCPEESLYSQLPHGPTDYFTAGTSEESAGWRRSQAVLAVAGPVEALTWWGLDLDYMPESNTWHECEESDTTFEISFHQDDSGVPGEVVCSYIIPVGRTPIGMLYEGAELNEYSAVLPEACVLVNGWVSIVGLGDPECWFLWMSSTDGEGSYCDNCLPPSQVPLNICLQGTLGGANGACCDDDTGECEDGVDIVSCLGKNQRFAPDALCADFDPPCGAVLGACCLDDATCSFEFEDDCAAGGGGWLGPNSACEQCPCATPCPLGGSAEGEPACTDGYVDTFNGGCAAASPAFSSVSFCKTVCGKSGVFLDGADLVPDFDWYEIIVTDETELTWTVEAEFPVQSWIVNGDLGCDDYVVVATETNLECTQFSAAASVSPGTYWLVIAPDTSSGVAQCGARYTARATLSTPCLGDADGDGDVDLIDHSVFVVCMAGPEQTPAPPPPFPPEECLALFDFDRDADVDMADAHWFRLAFTGEITGSAGDCCEVGNPDGPPGCNDPIIQACVCEVDPFCCETYWDATCVAEVEALGCGECD